MNAHYQRGAVLLAVSIALAIIAAVAFMGNREAGMGAEAVLMQKEMEDARLLAEAGFNHARWVGNTIGCTSLPLIGSTKTVTGALSGVGTYTAVISRYTADPLITNTIDIQATGKTQAGTSATIKRTNLRPHQTATTTSSINSVGDTYIKDSAPTSNFGSVTYFEVARNSSGNSRGMMNFNPNSNIRNGSIIKATLVLVLASGTAANALNVAIHRSKTKWNDTSATWLNSDTGVNWKSAGGDYAPGDAFVNGSVNSGVYSADITQLLEGWYANGLSEYGIFFTGADGKTTNPVAFYTRDVTGGQSNKPSLEVKYNIACASLP